MKTNRESFCWLLDFCQKSIVQTEILQISSPIKMLASCIFAQIKTHNRWSNTKYIIGKIRWFGALQLQQISYSLAKILQKHNKQSFCLPYPALPSTPKKRACLFHKFYSDPERRFTAMMTVISRDMFCLELNLGVASSGSNTRV